MYVSNKYFKYGNYILCFDTFSQNFAIHVPHKLSNFATGSVLSPQWRALELKWLFLERSLSTDLRVDYLSTKICVYYQRLHVFRDVYLNITSMMYLLNLLPAQRPQACLVQNNNFIYMLSKDQDFLWKLILVWYALWLFDWLSGWLIDLLIEYLIDWLIDWLIDLLIDWLIDW